MKKAFFLFAMIAAVVGCNSNDNSDGGTGTGPRSTDEDTAATNVQHVENVNGNIPDTANSINIGNEKDNTGDTTKH